jgi:glycerol-3-phosphate dehydrogenase
MTTTKLSAADRESYLQEMASEQLDILVIGGGITGAGIAWDAAVRGMKVGLIEMQDFAAGTSSRSTKLVHGGLRYLKQGEVKLVREVGRERALLHKRLPHLVEPMPMLLPVYRGGTYGYYTSSIGIYIYDWLAGVKRSERRQMVRRQQALLMEPLLEAEGLRGAGRYYEYRTDDARLTMEIVKTAVSCGAIVCNYAKAVDLIYQKGRATGVTVLDMLGGKSFQLHARKIINATGPWVDELRRIDRSLSDKHLLLTKGVHLVVARERLPISQAVYFDAPDGRMIFAIPRGAKTYIGTTDTVYEGDPRHPAVSMEDAQYLLDATNRVFPKSRLSIMDVEAAWAGLRPLIHEEGKSPSEVSRKDEIFVSASGLISIAGGKLTGFRKMAEKVVNLAAQQLEEETGVIYPPCTTDRVPISSGAAEDGASYEQARQRIAQEAAELGLPSSEIDDLVFRYGVNARQILQLYRTLSKDLPNHDDRLLAAEVNYSIEHEMTVSAVDFLLRRTGWMLFDRLRMFDVSARVVEYMGDRLGWDDMKRSQELADIVEETKRYSIADLR